MLCDDIPNRITGYVLGVQRRFEPAFLTDKSEAKLFHFFVFDGSFIRRLLGGRVEVELLVVVVEASVGFVGFHQHDVVADVLADG